MRVGHRQGLIAACVLLVGAVALSWQTFVGAHSSQPSIDFNRDIRPILTHNCTSCHGGVKQAGDVSLIFRDQVLGKGKSGRPVVVPGNAGASELFNRIVSHDPELRMPLNAPALSQKEMDLLERWIDEGAQWADYWSFVPPQSQALPDVKNAEWVRNPLDRFVLARLEAEGLTPSPEAGKAQLLRRVSLDLTGLPPSPEELEAFLADTSDDAYEKQVDRLLASPAYGERWAALWLDLARYADSKGFERDTHRPMWAYRDWVINAFNRNMPYDDFVVRQLAGDLIDKAGLDDHIATAFHRLTPANDEAGTDDEEFRLAAVMDRSATTWSVLNGVTMNCVQCHAHPYDPIKNKEYYTFLAFMNTASDGDVQYGDNRPVAYVPEHEQDKDRFDVLGQRKEALSRQIVAQGRNLVQKAAWRQLPIRSALVNENKALRDRIGKLEAAKRRQQHPFPQFNNAPFRYNSKQLAGFYNGEIRTARKQLRSRPGDPKESLPVKEGELRAGGLTIPSIMVLEMETGPVSAGLTALRVEVLPEDIRKALHSPEGGFITDAVRASVIAPNGARRPIDFDLFAFDTIENLEDAFADNPRFPGGFSANSKLSHPRWLVAVPKAGTAIAQGSRIALELWQSRGIEETKPAAPRRLRVLASNDPRWTAMAADGTLKARLAEFGQVMTELESAPHLKLPIIAEQPAYHRRQTLEFSRGNFMEKVGEPLSPGVPALFPAFPSDKPANRLTMAQWFFQPDQPLTARVAVNRYWEQLFGLGIVETLEDFGSSGDMPSHPELLDWLALYYQDDLGWDNKALLREIVTSATYRQDSRMTELLRQKDPRNRLLARGPAQRLTAEMVRDQALFASGLYHAQIGGPSVMPPQPKGTWAGFLFFDGPLWVDAVDEQRYRRAIYTYVKRSSNYPSFASFDASDHQLSLARRIPTNTPLQALVTLNDVVYREAADGLAQRMQEQFGGSSDDSVEKQLNYGGRLVLSRDLTKTELKVLKELHSDLKKQHGYSDRRALKEMASALLNLDAALTR